MKVKGSFNVTFDESPPPTKLLPLVDYDVGEEEAIERNVKVVDNNNIEDESIEVNEIVNIKESKNHPLEQDLVPLPKNQSIIGTKWVFRNKLDENGIVSRNMVRLVAQGYNQQEGIDYNETYASVARLESIRILLALACAKDFKLYQIDVKSAFLNGFINEEVYAAQPPGFIDFEKHNYVYKLKKAFYGLKQALKAFETYVKSKDIDSWHITVYGDYNLTVKNMETGKEEIIPYNKKMLSKNDKAKMVLYNALPKREYERIFMCKTAKDIWNSLVITHQVKREKYKSLALKAKKISSDEEASRSDNDDEEYVMASDSDEDDDPKKDGMCLMAYDSNEVLSDTPY
ncbi:retrovirus-related pol polyprotein from transposon TNT 1-94 [Tanacetum coccineum]